MKKFLLLLAVCPALLSAAEAVDVDYECGYLQGATGSVTVTVEPKEADVECTIDAGTMAPGANTIKAQAKTPVTGGSAVVTFSFGTAPK